MADKRINLLIQPNTDINSQRMQDNSLQAIKLINDKLDKMPKLISEQENGTDKIYNDGVQYEVFHNLGRVCTALSVAYSTSPENCFVVEDSNPSNLDRSKYVRVGVFLPFGGTAKLKFWVN